MDDPIKNDENNASQAMQKARNLAQAHAQAKDANKKENSSNKNGAILRVNNYQSGIPEAKCKMSKNPNFPTSLKQGYIVRSRSGESSFIVEAKLAARVYMVRNQKNDKFCAMKIEPYHNEGDVKQLRRDVFILMEAMKQDQRFSHHFQKIISKARVADNFNYIITSLCDYNLDELREKVLKSDFSVHTAARLSMQAFEAVHDLHLLGYIHRNIAPSKFMLGLENSALIYLGGFSTAYHYKQKDGRESPSPRKLYKMQKTRFLPRAYHCFKDFLLFDDLESWLYTAIDLFGRKLLPWFDNMDESQIIANKEKFFFDAFEEIFTYAPKQLQVIQRYIDKNNDGDKPDYTFMGITLVGMREEYKFPYSGQFDFQVGSDLSTTSNSTGPRHKHLTTEKENDGGENNGLAIASMTSAIKEKKHSISPAIFPQSLNGEVFEEGEAELPQNADSEPFISVDQSLSMARKKMTPKDDATAKATEMDNGEKAVFHNEEHRAIRERALTCKNFKLLYDKSIFTLLKHGKFWRPVAIPDFTKAPPQFQAVVDKSRQIEAMITKTAYFTSGTYGSISLCRIKGLQPLFVFKTLKNIRRDVEEIHSELNVYSKIDSPFFPKLFFAGIYPGSIYCLITEYISGGTLDDNQSRIAVADVRFIAYELFQGLQCLHKLKLSHNDLKGNNVALTSDGHVKILDFGLSRDITVPRLLPTSPNMAPEVRRRLPAGAAADYYSYGRVLLNLIQKDVPVFDLKKKSGDDVADHFIIQCLTKDPESRMKTVLEHPYLKLENARPTFIPGPFTIPQCQQPEDEIVKARLTFGFDKYVCENIFIQQLFLFPSIKTYQNFKQLL